jgi:beta-glucosidase
VTADLARAAAFPPGFLWGAATASHQVEGGNRWNDWWALEEAGRLPFRSGDACRHFELYERDFDMARAWGHNAHRLSIEWSRIEPSPGEWNMEAIEHYLRVIEALRRRGMEPVVTLHHFSNPQWFAQRGGWTRWGSVASFARYASVVAKHLSPHVRFWISVNEPTVYVKRAYIAGDWPPCRPRSPLEGARALINMYRAHHAARKALHAARADVMVGIAHSAPFVEPCNPRRWLDRSAAFWRDMALNRIVMRLALGVRGRGMDFIGINYYTRQIARWGAKGGGALFGTECVENHHAAPREFNALGWEIYPPGLAHTLRRFSKHGLPLVVTENGLATTDETQRSAFVASHIGQLRQALGEGINVLGYLYWTLMDNYEWSAGTVPRFGLAAVDFATQERQERPAAAVLSALLGGAPMRSAACAARKDDMSHAARLPV